MTTTGLMDQLKQQNITTWLETEVLKAGTENQRERWAAQLLPEEEILTLARAELFKGFDLPRWHTNEVRREMRTAIRHSSGQACATMFPEFEVAEVGELDASAWDALKHLSMLVSTVNQHPWIGLTGEPVTLVTFSHWATCPVCGSEVVRSGSKVSIPWAGRTLVREFRL